MSFARNVRALYEAALDELWALLTHFVMNGGKDNETHH